MAHGSEPAVDVVNVKSFGPLMSDGGPAGVVVIDENDDVIILQGPMAAKMLNQQPEKRQYRKRTIKEPVTPHGRVKGSRKVNPHEL